MNADNYHTIQSLRRKVQDLEKHKFVLGYKAETYAAALEPQQEAVGRLQGELEGHGRELLGAMNRAKVGPGVRVAGVGGVAGVDRPEHVKAVKGAVGRGGLEVYSQYSQYTPPHARTRACMRVCVCM